MGLFGAKSFEYSFFYVLQNSARWRSYLSCHFTYKKTKVGGVKLLAKFMKIVEQGFPLESLQLQSLNLFSIMLFGENPRGIFFFFFGLDQITM